MLINLIEIEPLITEAVDSVIDQKHNLIGYRDSLVESLLRACNNDTSWILQYGNTGELQVPELGSEHPPDLTQQVLEVCICS